METHRVSKSAKADRRRLNQRFRRGAIDLVGAWLWATGNTYAHKDALKAAGFAWASRKRAWYWRPAWAAVERASKKTLSEIMDKYGAQRIISASDERCPTLRLATA